jgi:hypothetical protein
LVLQGAGKKVLVGTRKRDDEEKAEMGLFEWTFALDWKM